MARTEEKLEEGGRKTSAWIGSPDETRRSLRWILLRPRVPGCMPSKTSVMYILLLVGEGGREGGRVHRLMVGSGGCILEVKRETRCHHLCVCGKTPTNHLLFTELEEAGGRC